MKFRVLILLYVLILLPLATTVAQEADSIAVATTSDLITEPAAIAKEVAPKSVASAAAIPSAQTPLATQLVQIGFLSYDSVLTAMPRYALVQARQQELRQAYEDELKRVEQEFNQKYEAFLEGMRDFPRTILLKRQTELQQLFEKNVAFKRQGLKELERAYDDALAPLRQQIDKAIADVARQKGLILVVNTDSRACPFIDPDMGIDVQNEVQKMVNGR